MFCVFYCRGRVCAHERSRVGIIIRWQLLTVIFGYNDSDGGCCLVTIDPLRIISLVLIDPLTDTGYE
jgi:hypothetical protein